MATVTDVKDMATRLLFFPLAAVVLLTFLSEHRKVLEAKSKSWAEIYRDAQRIYKGAQESGPLPLVIEHQDLDKVLAFLVKNGMLTELTQISWVYSITPYGNEVGETTWAARLAFLRAP